jgi:hypothetical protein
MVTIGCPESKRLDFKDILNPQIFGIIKKLSHNLKARFQAGVLEHWDLRRRNLLHQKYPPFLAPGSLLFEAAINATVVDGEANMERLKQIATDLYEAVNNWEYNDERAPDFAAFDINGKGISLVFEALAYKLGAFLKSDFDEQHPIEVLTTSSDRAYVMLVFAASVLRYEEIMMKLLIKHD